MDKDGYPEYKELKIIAKWDFRKKSIQEFLEYIRERWHYQGCGGFNLSGKKILQLRLNTFGWSGNESILSAVKINTVFWLMCWRKSTVGGHYWFRVKLNLFKEKNGK